MQPFSSSDRSAILSPEFAETPPAIATSLIPVFRIAFSIFSIKMVMMECCIEAQISALFSSMKFGFSFSCFFCVPLTLLGFCDEHLMVAHFFEVLKSGL